ncbi:MAG: hypothetical protein K2K28_02910, partial [Clostridia bacterium]|nr:hypothetical protein [Clostridia bacterium]
MKLKSTRSILTVMLSVLCSVLFCCSVGMISGVNGKNATAKAPSSGTINLDSGNTSTPIRGEGLVELYDKIMDNTDVTNAGTLNKLKDWFFGNNARGVKKHASPNTTTTPLASSTDNYDAIRYDQFASNIDVTFGGMDWHVVYMTKNRSDELVLTLWLCEPNGTSSFSGGTGYSPANAASNSQPSTIYGASYIRSQALGIGSSYYTYSGANTTTSTLVSSTSAQATASSSVFYKFAQGDYAGLLDSPSDLYYQEFESSQHSHAHEGTYRFANEAYGNDADLTSHGAGPWNVANRLDLLPSCNGYYDWQGDKIWLPSWSEVGNIRYGSNSIWGTRGQIPTTTTSSLNSYLRTGSDINAQGAFGLTPTDSYDGQPSSTVFGVRPALHLNLKKAQDAADYMPVKVPVDMSITYDGNTMGIGDVAEKIIYEQLQRINGGIVTDSVAADASNSKNVSVNKWYDGDAHAVGGLTATGVADANGYYGTSKSMLVYKIVKYIKGDGTGTDSVSSLTSLEPTMRNAGVYTIECMVNTANGRYRLKDASTGAVEASVTATKQFKVTINQKEVKYKWKNTGLTNWETTFDVDTFTP